MYMREVYWREKDFQTTYEYRKNVKIHGETKTLLKIFIYIRVYCTKLLFVGPNLHIDVKNREQILKYKNVLP